jgi:hypothetical protein
MDWLAMILPTGSVWLTNEVPARRISPWRGSKEARVPITLESDLPAAVLFKATEERSGAWHR